MKRLEKKSLPKLKAELDRIYSLWIRQRDAKNGLNKCVTCGKVKHWRELQCGHYYSRTVLPLRYDEHNTAPQCVSCNMFSEGNKPAYTMYLIRTYGNDILNHLESKKNNKMKFDRLAYTALIEEYKQKILTIKGEIK